MPHIHLPVQSGDDKILKIMSRRYTIASYKELVKRIRTKIQPVAITTDIIVGFPGESEENFENTLRLVDEIQYDGAFTFIYSPRVGTPAAKMEDNVTIEEKKKRFKRLTDHINRHQLAIYQKFQDQTIEVLVDGFSKKNESMLSGYSKDMKLVHFKGDSKWIGKLVYVHITKCKTFTLEGELVETKCTSS